MCLQDPYLSVAKKPVQVITSAANATCKRGKRGREPSANPFVMLDCKLGEGHSLWVCECDVSVAVT